MSHPVTRSMALNGIGASAGVSVGKAFVIDRKKARVPKVKIKKKEDLVGELERLKNAVALSDDQLEALKSKLAAGDGHDHVLILEAHRLMLHDPMFIEEVTRFINDEQINAEWAVRKVSRKIKHLFDNIEDQYFRERRADVDFVADRLVRNLMGHDVDVSVEIPEGAVVVAHDLTPADTAMLLKTGKVVGFVTDVGSQTGHTAIVARARECPAVVGVTKASESISPGDTVAVDGVRGMILINPTDAQLRLYNETRRRYQENEQSALRQKDLPAVSTDGFRVLLNGNIEFADEVPSLISHGAEGIGLFRTEFLFLERDSVPTEDEHYEVYKEVLEAMGGRPVVIRTIDLGGDKVPGKKASKEANPAMGLRAIRYCLKHRELFRAQLRALLRASVHGQLKVMFPLMTGMSELREARSELEHCRSELGRAGVPVGKPFPVGMMIETPSAAWMADRFAEEVDFFSIGTNDLIQYSLAIDRQNRDVAYLYNPLHPAVLRMLQHVVNAAHDAGIPVSMCGEMAGSPTYTLVLLAMGFTELSMTSGRLPLVKRIIRQLSRADAKAIFDQAMALSTSEEIERFVRSELDKRCLMGD